MKGKTKIYVTQRYFLFAPIYYLVLRLVSLTPMQKYKESNGLNLLKIGVFAIKICRLNSVSVLVSYCYFKVHVFQWRWPRHKCFKSKTFCINVGAGTQGAKIIMCCCFNTKINLFKFQISKFLFLHYKLTKAI